MGTKNYVHENYLYARNKPKKNVLCVNCVKKGDKTDPCTATGSILDNQWFTLLKSHNHPPNPSEIKQKELMSKIK